MDWNMQNQAISSKTITRESIRQKALEPEFEVRAKPMKSKTMRKRKSNFLSKLGNNNYLVNHYARPRGLCTMPKVHVMSEAEQFFKDRYSKKNTDDIKYNKRNTVLGRTTTADGFKGRKMLRSQYSRHRLSQHSSDTKVRLSSNI